MKVIEEKLKEAVLSIFPVIIIMFIIGFCLAFHMVTMISILISTLLLILGCLKKVVYYGCKEVVYTIKIVFI